jgi:hypothetical protein
MLLWHVLSQERLDQKLAHANGGAGELLLTAPAADKDVSSGRLGCPFIYCLPNIVGSEDFAEPGEGGLRAIRIELDPSAKIAVFHGNPDDIPFETLKEDFDGIDMQVDAMPEWPVRFRQILLWNPKAVKSWTCDEKDIAADFRTQYRELAAGRMPAADFFLTDLTPEEHQTRAEALASRLNIKLGPPPASPPRPKPASPPSP